MKALAALMFLVVATVSQAGVLDEVLGPDSPGAPSEASGLSALDSVQTWSTVNYEDMGARERDGVMEEFGPMVMGFGVPLVNKGELLEGMTSQENNMFLGREAENTSASAFMPEASLYTGSGNYFLNGRDTQAPATLVGSESGETDFMGAYRDLSEKYWRERKRNQQTE